MVPKVIMPLPQYDIQRNTTIHEKAANQVISWGLYRPYPQLIIFCIDSETDIFLLFIDLNVIKPQISISPKVSVVEGDRVQITCKVQNHPNVELFLTKNNTVLHKSYTTFAHSLTVRAEDSGEYVCKAEKDSVQKTAYYRLNVAGN